MTNRQLLKVAITLPAGMTMDAAVTVAAMVGRLGFWALYLERGSRRLAGLNQLRVLAAPTLVVMDSGVNHPWIVRVNDPDEVSAVRARLDRDHSARPLLVAVPISIGRTLNEATARADLEPRFTGPRDPRLVGIFGTLEQAQEQVLALARAGASALVLDAPLAFDGADVLAQIRALVVGATPQLRGTSPTDTHPRTRPTAFPG
jgi:hypothetical protein